MADPTPPIDVPEYVSKLSEAQKYGEYDSIELRLPGVHGVLLDVVCEAVS